jgi:hypothetical protein
VRRALRWVLVGWLVVVVTGCAAVVSVPGRVDGATLNDSVGSAVSDQVTRGIGYDASCTRSGAARWRCELTTTDQSDGGVIYVVTTSGNCWSARLVDTAGMLGLPGRASDCIHLLDQLTD